MESKEIENIEKEFENEYQNVVKIVDQLNEFGSLLLGDLYSPLLVNRDDKFIYFKLIILKYNYLKDSLEEDRNYSLDYLSTFAFKALFIGDEMLKLDDLDNKLKYFDIILTTLKGKTHPDENSILQLLKKKQFVEIFDLISHKFDLGFIGFVALVILNSKTSTDIFLNFFYSILSYFYDFKTDFSFNDIKSISLEQILNDITKIITGPSEANYFKLIFTGKHIEKVFIGPEELEKIIKSEKKIFPLDKKKNKKNKNKIKKGPVIQKKSFEKITQNESREIQYMKKKENNENNAQQNKNENKILISNSEIIESKEGEESEEEEEPKIGEGLNVEESKEVEESKQNDTRDEQTINKKKEDISKEYLDEILEQNKNLLNEFNNMKKKVDKLVESNNILIESNNILETKVSKLENKTQKLVQKDKKRRKIVSDIQLKMTKIESDLIIIKFRDNIKAFIDYCYKGFAFDLSKPIGYDDKVNNIILKISHLKYKSDYDENIVEILIKILSNIKYQLKTGNVMAHTFDSTKPIFDQIIENINDKNINFSTFKERFDNIKASNKIKTIVFTRERYYNNRKQLELEEEKIFEDIEDLDKNLLKKYVK